MRRSLLLALAVMLLLVSTATAQIIPTGPSATPAPESADILLGEGAPYWSRWTSQTDLVQDRGGVRMRVDWTGVTEVSRIPSAVRALSVATPQTYIAIRLRVENATASDATIREPNGGNIFAAGGATLVTNLGDVAVRDFGNSEGRSEIPRGTYRTYDLLFLADQPSAEIQTMTLSIPRLRGVRSVPIGDSDYSLSIQMLGL